jgi:nitrite reductase/ring-hydroxylating ferredoxin subunit
MSSTTDLRWHRVADPDELPEGRVKTVAAGTRSLALTHVDGEYAALDNHCPHQGGPLGEGSIEGGLLRCPWHGYDYCPLSGESPGGFSGELWQATGFRGAELTYSELLAATNQRATALDFFTTRKDALRS